MSTDLNLELYRQLLNAQAKYAYFLVGTSGTAIAFTLHQTKGMKLSWSQIPLALSLTFFGLSFFAGYRNIAHAALTIANNSEQLKQTHEKNVHLSIQDAIKHNGRMAAINALRQFRFLAIGSIFYISWHIIEMYLRTIS